MATYIQDTDTAAIEHRHEVVSNILLMTLHDLSPMQVITI